MANDINLAALWVPVMPETRGMVPAMRKAGEESKAAFEQGFSGGGSRHAEQMGQQYANQFMRSFNASFAGLPIPRGLQDFMGSFRRENELTEGQLNRLRTTATRSYSEMGRAQQEMAQHQQKLTGLQHYYNQALAEGNTKQADFQRSRMDRVMVLHSQAAAKATEHQEKYTTATDKLTVATGKASMAQNIMIGVAGGALGAGLTIGANGIMALTTAYKDFVVGGVHLATNALKEFSAFVVETGESYQNLSHQLELYTTASGGHLEALNASAARVYGDMDSGAQQVGQTMAILSQRLGLEAGPALEKLVYHAEELRGRFGQLDVEALASGMIAFGVSGTEADAALASLVQSARGAGTPINDVVTALRTAAPTLEAAGLNYEQTAAFIAEMTKRGLEARSMMTGLQTAEGKFGELGLNFADGMKLAATRMNEMVAAGDEAAAQNLAQELFGTRRWAEAMTMMEAFSDIVASQPGQFSASADSLDHLIDNTQTLSEKWEEVKRQAQEALRPLGAAAIGALGTAMTRIKTTIDNNMAGIFDRIEAFGLGFIEQLPMIQEFTATMITLFGHAFDFIAENVGLTMYALGAMMRGIGATLSLIPEPLRKAFGINDFKTSIDEIGNSLGYVGTQLREVEVSTEADNLAEWVREMNINVPDLQDNWRNTIDEIRNTTLPDFTGGVGAGAGVGANKWGIPTANISPPGADSGGTPGGGFIKPGGSLPIPNAPLPKSVPGSNPFNAEAWRPTVRSVLQQVGPAYGIKNLKAWEDALVTQIETESGGNPNSENPSDSNGQGGTQYVAGLLNFLDTTYKGANISGRPYMDPIGQIAAAIELTMRHGLDSDGGPRVIGEGHGFYQGGGFVGSSPFDDPTEPIDARALQLWWAHQQGNAAVFPIPGTPGAGYQSGGMVTGRNVNPFDPHRNIAEHPSPSTLGGGDSGQWWGFGPYGTVPPGLIWAWLKQMELERKSKEGMGFQSGGWVPTRSPRGPVGIDHSSDNTNPLAPWWDMDWMPPERPGNVGPGNGRWWERGPTKGGKSAFKFPPLGQQPGFRKPGPGDQPLPDSRIKMWGFDEGGSVGGQSVWDRIKSGEGVFNWRSMLPRVVKEGPSFDTLAPYAQAAISYPLALGGRLVGGIQRGLSKIPGIQEAASSGDWSHNWTHPWDIPGESQQWWPTSHYKQDGGWGPRGTDTVPAWLTPGEFVVNAESARLFAPMLAKMNSIRHLQDGGDVVGGSSDPQAHGVNPAISYIADIAAGYGLDVMSGVRNESGSHHHTGEAGDFASPGQRDTDEMLAFAMAMRQQFGSQLAELIYHDPRFSGMQIGEGQPVDDSYYANAGDHHDHVHVAVREGSEFNAAVGSGQLPTSSPMSTSMGMPPMPGGTGPSMPGSPYGTPGFTGGYGPQDWEAKARNEESVREAHQRASDMDAEIADKKEALAKLEAERAEAALGEMDEYGLGVRKPPDQEKIAALDEQIADSKEDIARSTRERGDQNSEIATAERKLAEGVKSKGSQQQEYEIPGVSAFTQLGGGLVKGLAQGFGFGEVFGKAPWEWGITKLLAGGLNWGLGTANAWADEIGKGHTGMTNFTEIPGWEQQGSAGLMSLLGGMSPTLGQILPKPVAVNNFGQPVSTGPNVSTATDGMPSPYGAFGPPPGPVDNSVTVNNNGPRQSDIQAWQHEQNKRTAPVLHGGGLPRP